MSDYAIRRKHQAQRERLQAAVSAAEARVKEAERAVLDTVLQDDFIDFPGDRSILMMRRDNCNQADRTLSDARAALAKFEEREG